MQYSVTTLPPNDKIYDFKGKMEDKSTLQEEALSLENTLWANTVLASTGYILGLVLYTGVETRAQMNSKMPRSKVGLLDSEINFLSKVLFILMLFIAFVMTVLDGFEGSWYFKYFRFVLLLASIIPISLRVNLDLAKIYYSYKINNDNLIEGTIARNSTIPEELGRIQFLLSDKTGTLTQNDMIFKKVSMEFAQFTLDTLEDMRR
jgi:phospholipid-translocating ATPase